jgi:transcriptional regulator with XRE-family HTH domain
VVQPTLAWRAPNMVQLNMGRHFRTRLREARVRAGLTQALLAQRFGVTQGAVSVWETGGTKPPGDLRAKVVAWIEATEAEEEASDDEQDTSSPFGEWVANERLSRGWSRSELADQAGVSAQAVYLIETGRVRNPWKQTRDSLVKAFGNKAAPEEVLEDIADESEIAGGRRLNDFLPWDEGTIPQSACVYVYYDRTDRPIYIGQTNNLHRRNVQHQENDKWFFRRLVERGAYVELAAKSDRDDMEKLLIHFLGRNTMFNKHHAKD